LIANSGQYSGKRIRCFLSLARMTRCVCGKGREGRLGDGVKFATLPAASGDGGLAGPGYDSEHVQITGILRIFRRIHCLFVQYSSCTRFSILRTHQADTQRHRATDINDQCNTNTPFGPNRAFEEPGLRMITPKSKLGPLLEPRPHFKRLLCPLKIG
jgi:hypothetical protein